MLELNDFAQPIHEPAFPPARMVRRAGCGDAAWWRFGASAVAGGLVRQPGRDSPGFWDPRRRPERPDLSRVTLIRFVTEIDYPPFNYAGADGNPAGFNVDFARMICEELKIACTVQMRRFDTLLTALDENRGDAVMASIAVTPDVRKRVDFSEPYYRTPARFVARREVSIDEVRPEGLEGKEVAVVAGTAHEAFLKKVFTEVSVRPYPTAAQALEALRRGDVGLMFGDGISLAFWLNGSELAELLPVPRWIVHRKPLFRRGRRHRGQEGQRRAPPGLQLGAVPPLGKRPLQRSLAALLPGESVLDRESSPQLRHSITETFLSAKPVGLFNLATTA